MKRKLTLALAVAALAAVTAVSAADPIFDTWNPGAYFNMNFGGPEKSNGYRFGAKLSLSEQAVNKIYGGNALLRAHRALKGEGAGELPAYLKFDFNSGKDFTAQWLGADVYRYDYVLKEASSPMANNFLGPFNAADSWAMIVTGSVIGAAGMGYGISQWTSSGPVQTAAAAVCENPLLLAPACAACINGFAPPTCTPIIDLCLGVVCLGPGEVCVGGVCTAL